MKRRPSRSKTKPVEMFVSYSHINSTWFDRLRPVLKFNRCRDKSIAWNDKDDWLTDREPSERRSLSLTKSDLSVLKRVPRSNQSQRLSA